MKPLFQLSVYSDKTPIDSFKHKAAYFVRVPKEELESELAFYTALFPAHQWMTSTIKTKDSVMFLKYLKK